LTSYQQSYDGRNLEPVVLPVRFPLLLALGAEGIAVGLTTRILPHNFIELLEAQKSYLRGEEFEIFPDFLTGGLADVTNYDEGRPGSRLKVRALIEKGSGKSVIIREVPHGITTEALIDSILSANEKGKIKVAHVEDNSAAEIEIVVTFQRGVDMEKAIDALYAFTYCEVSVAATCMVIRNGRPKAMAVSELLIENAKQTRSLLKQDLLIQQENLEREWHLKSLVQIFVENRIYLRIEKCETWEAVLDEIDFGLEPHKARLRREITRDDLIYLTEVKMRRISAWDAERARDELTAIDEKLAEIARFLRNMTQYTIRYYDHLLEKYSEGRERRTQLSSFDAVKAVSVVERTEKLFADQKTGFVGTDSKIGEEMGPCSNLDDLLVILQDGGLIVTKVAAKKYVGEDILHLQVFRPRDREKVFNIIYENTGNDRTYCKRFSVGGVTRDKRYELGSGKKGSRIFHLSEGEGSFAYVKLRKKPRIKTDLYVRFDELLVKGRGARGVLLTKHKVSSTKPISERVYCDRMEISSGELPAVCQDSVPKEDAKKNAPPEASTSDRKADEDSDSDPPSKQRGLF
jgi:topoisomerase-4 subunit A